MATRRAVRWRHSLSVWRRRVKLIVTWVAGSLTAFAALAYQDPLVQPAEASALAAQAPLTAMAHAGERLVAVGQRGIVVYAEEQRRPLQWHQAAVPVGADLTGVSFATARDGWAVGHGAVVLHSGDGGITWSKQADGKSLGDSALSFYEAQPGGAEPDRRRATIEQARRLAEERETQPLLDVWFKDAKTGYVVGTFNRIYRTDDGGAHWTPLIDRTDNPEGLHFYAVHGAGSEVYLAGERGMVWRWDETQSRFVVVRTPYEGSLFGVIITPRSVLAYGMRGSLFRSTDRGAHWQRIDTGLRAGIVAGDLRPRGEIVLVALSGDVIVSVDDGASFQAASPSRHQPASAALATADGLLVTAGAAGVHEEGIDLAGKR